jgi:hypothetical protein
MFISAPAPITPSSSRRIPNSFLCWDYPNTWQDINAHPRYRRDGGTPRLFTNPQRSNAVGLGAQSAGKIFAHQIMADRFVSKCRFSRHRIYFVIY